MSARTTPVVVVGKTATDDHGSTRYFLSNGWRIAREQKIYRRHYREMPYTVWAPGAGEGGCAGHICSTRTLAAALGHVNGRTLTRDGRLAPPFVSSWASVSKAGAR